MRDGVCVTLTATAYYGRRQISNGKCATACSVAICWLCGTDGQKNRSKYGNSRYRPRSCDYGLRRYNRRKRELRRRRLRRCHHAQGLHFAATPCQARKRRQRTHRKVPPRQHRSRGTVLFQEHNQRNYGCRSARSYFAHRKQTRGRRGVRIYAQSD